MVKIKIKIPKIFHLSFLMIIYSTQGVFSQTTLSNSDAENVISGNYNVLDYHPSTLIYQKDSVIDGVLSELSQDSLLSYLIGLEKYGNRNSGSDTISNTKGIGAARRYIHKKFEEFSIANENRLEVGYLNFFKNMCGMLEHRNVFAVLPGLDSSRTDIVFVEAHFDSRCESNCDTSCYAPGMDDNGSGTALVMELARVMSKYAYDRTIVFTTVTGEEQGLNGGLAWAQYFKDNSIGLIACLNNDVVGGIECGPTSSPPSCSPSGSLDSVNLRVFSYSQLNDSDLVSPGKQLARYVKLQQIEEINPRIKSDFNIDLQIREDRVGRGGDHIPFRQRGFTSIRLTSSHEHGNGSGQAGDRQHTVNDILGIDLSIPPDGVLDSFYIDFPYLLKNTLTNAVNLGLLANSPPQPDPVYELNKFGNVQAIVFENADTNYSHRIGVRKNNSTDLYFDTVINVNGHRIDVLDLYPKGDVQLHTMNVDKEIESIPQVHHSEQYLSNKNISEPINCVVISPNPASEKLSLRWTCSITPNALGLSIFSSSGRKIDEVELDPHLTTKGQTIDVSHLEKGIYEFVIVLNENEKFIQKILIN